MYRVLHNEDQLVHSLVYLQYFMVTGQKRYVIVNVSVEHCAARATSGTGSLYVWHVADQGWYRQYSSRYSRKQSIRSGRKYGAESTADLAREGNQNGTRGKGRASL